MSYEDFETSRAKGRPINLFLLRYGAAANSYFAYTDAEQAIVKDSITYQPITISRGKIAVSGTLDKSVMEIRAQRDSAIATLFLFYPPPDVVSVIIFQGHINDPASEFLVGWSGRVTQAKRTDEEVVLSCEPVATSMKRVGLRQNYQYSCTVELYGSRCGANKAAATIQRPLQAVGANTATLASGWVAPGEVQKYLGGMIEWVNPAGDREFRTILRIASDQIFTLSGPTQHLEVGSVIDVVKGCPRTMEGCIDHDNIHNYRACPFIPKTNPIGNVNQFY